MLRPSTHSSLSLLSVSHEPHIPQVQRSGKDPSEVINLANIMRGPVVQPMQQLGFLSRLTYPAFRPELSMSGQYGHYYGVQGDRYLPQQVITHASLHQPDITAMSDDERWAKIQDIMKRNRQHNHADEVTVVPVAMPKLVIDETPQANLGEGQVEVVHSEEDFDNCLQQ